jgi:hypothetical protein
MMRWITILMRDRVGQLLTDWRSGKRSEFERNTFVSSAMAR